MYRFLRATERFVKVPVNWTSATEEELQRHNSWHGQENKLEKKDHHRQNSAPIYSKSSPETAGVEHSGSEWKENSESEEEEEEDEEEQIEVIIDQDRMSHEGREGMINGEIVNGDQDKESTKAVFELSSMESQTGQEKQVDSLSYSPSQHKHSQHRAKRHDQSPTKLLHQVGSHESHQDVLPMGKLASKGSSIMNSNPYSTIDYSHNNPIIDASSKLLSWKPNQESKLQSIKHQSAPFLSSARKSIFDSLSDSQKKELSRLILLRSKALQKGNRSPDIAVVNMLDVVTQKTPLPQAFQSLSI